MFGEKSFEIDDDGQSLVDLPGYAISRSVFSAARPSAAPSSSNASTGECQDLSVYDVPEWVDRVYPAESADRAVQLVRQVPERLAEQLLGQNGVVRTTPGTDGTLGYNYIAKDDDVWVYTGVTSATADNSIIGFVLVNQRTRKVALLFGFGCDRGFGDAIGRGPGSEPALHRRPSRFSSTSSNHPTYFMALKDDAGLVKKFAMVDIQRYQNVAVGDTVADTRSIRGRCSRPTACRERGSKAQRYAEASGPFKTIAQAVIEGNSHFYLTIEGPMAASSTSRCPVCSTSSPIGVGDTDLVHATSKVRPDRARSRDPR